MNNFTKYGNRTSSLQTLYPHFKSFQDQHHEGEIRYCEKKCLAMHSIFFHALFICLQRESFLAIHHLMGIALGYLFAAIYFFQIAEKPNKRTANF